MNALQRVLPVANIHAGERQLKGLLNTAPKLLVGKLEGCLGFRGPFAMVRVARLLDVLEDMEDVHGRTALRRADLHRKRVQEVPVVFGAVGEQDKRQVRTDIEDAPQFGSSVDTDFILGMGKIGESVKILLDIDKVLAGEDLSDF